MITVATMIIIYHDCHWYNNTNINEDSKTMVEAAINICMMITIYDTDSRNNNNDSDDNNNSSNDNDNDDDNDNKLNYCNRCNPVVHSYLIRILLAHL